MRSVTGPSLLFLTVTTSVGGDFSVCSSETSRPRKAAGILKGIESGILTFGTEEGDRNAMRLMVMIKPMSRRRLFEARRPMICGVFLGVSKGGRLTSSKRTGLRSV